MNILYSIYCRLRGLWRTVNQKEKKVLEIKNCIKVEIMQANFKSNGIMLLTGELHTPQSY